MKTAFTIRGFSKKEIGKVKSKTEIKLKSGDLQMTPSHQPQQENTDTLMLLANFSCNIMDKSQVKPAAWPWS